MHTPFIIDEIPAEEQQALLQKVATFIVKRRLTAPAVLTLGMCKPLHLIGGQLMIALNPFVQVIFNTTDFQKFALIIEQDQNLERLIQLIEQTSEKDEAGSEKFE